MVAEISNDWGVSWDSTCFWSNNTNWARYPQGGIYNAPATNTSNAMSSAYIVGSGPCTSAASSWVGNWYASKQLGGLNYNNAPSTAVGAQQFMTTVPSNTAVGKHSFLEFHSQVQMMEKLDQSALLIQMMLVLLLLL